MEVAAELGPETRGPPAQRWGWSELSLSPCPEQRGWIHFIETANNSGDAKIPSSDTASRGGFLRLGSFCYSAFSATIKSFGLVIGIWEKKRKSLC